MGYRKAVFIDKDGTLIPNIPYNVDPEKITLAQHATEALRMLQDEDYLLVVLTNQSGVAKGLFKETNLNQVRHKIKSLLSIESVHLSGFYSCPHHPEGIIPEYTKIATCRKPSTGMFLKASTDLSIDLTKSWMIADILHDVEAGNRAGCNSILINNGNATEWKNGPHRQPTYIAFDLLQAAEFILSNSTYRKHDKQHVSLTY